MISTKVNFISKRTMSVIRDFAIILIKDQSNGIKKKATNKDKYLNYHKIRYFRKVCIALNIQPPKKKYKKVFNQRLEIRNCAHIVVIVNDNSNTKPELFWPSKTYIAQEKVNIKENLQALKKVFYLNSCVSRDPTNNKDLFINKFLPKYLDFTIVGKQILCAKNINTIAIPLTNNLFINLQKVAYAPNYKSNMILQS